MPSKSSDREISNILGLETSCDETSAAVLSEGKVLSNIVSSQEIHSRFGGVVPELASREHIRLVTKIVGQAMRTAGISAENLDGIAVTHGPGLVGALLVGLNFSKGMAQALNIPFIGINHIEGHIYGNFLSHPDIKFPHLTLVVSGGHTQLVLMPGHLCYEILGTTRDDAVGEAFDKGAKLLGLGYPGGPEIDRLAKKGDDDFHRFPRSFLKGDNYEFSYSGLKTSLLVYIEEKGREYVEKNMSHICASYQKAACEVLVEKTMRAAKEYKARSVGMVGGVAANSLLRSWLAEQSAAAGIDFHVPAFEYCTDNAAMIAMAGWQRLQRGERSPNDLNAYPALKLSI